MTVTSKYPGNPVVHLRMLHGSLAVPLCTGDAVHVYLLTDDIDTATCEHCKSRVIRVDTDLIRECARHLKKEFSFYKTPPVDLPADHVIERVVQWIIDKAQDEVVMDTAELERLAKEALEDDRKATPGPWIRRHSTEILDYTPCSIDMPDGGYVETRPPVGDDGPRQCRDADFIANARTREPQLARAILSLLDERSATRRALAPAGVSEDVGIVALAEIIRSDLDGRTKEISSAIKALQDVKVIGEKIPGTWDGISEGIELLAASRDMHMAKRDEAAADLVRERQHRHSECERRDGVVKALRREVDEHNAKVDEVLKLIDTVDSARVTP